MSRNKHNPNKDFISSWLPQREVLHSKTEKLASIPKCFPGYRHDQFLGTSDFKQISDEFMCCLINKRCWLSANFQVIHETQMALRDSTWAHSQATFHFREKNTPEPTCRSSPYMAEHTWLSCFQSLQHTAVSANQFCLVTSLKLSLPLCSLIFNLRH